MPVVSGTRKLKADKVELEISQKPLVTTVNLETAGELKAPGIQKGNTSPRAAAVESDSDNTSSTSDGAAGCARERNLARRSRRRRAKYPIADLTKVGDGISLLEINSVSAKTAANYSQRVEALEAHSKCSQILDEAPSLLDMALVQFFH